MNRVQRTIDFFDKNYSCSQSVLAGFGSEYGLDEHTSFKIGRGFGSGMGLGETCGAVTGAIMVLGLSRGDVVGNDKDNRYQSYDVIRRFVSEFKKRRGTIVCREILGLDPSRKEELAQIRERNLFTEFCPKVVEEVAAILDEMI